MSNIPPNIVIINCHLIYASYTFLSVSIGNCLSTLNQLSISTAGSIWIQRLDDVSNCKHNTSLDT